MCKCKVFATLPIVTLWQLGQSNLIYDQEASRAMVCSALDIKFNHDFHSFVKRENHIPGLLHSSLLNVCTMLELDRLNATWKTKFHAVTIMPRAATWYHCQLRYFHTSWLTHLKLLFFVWSKILRNATATWLLIEHRVWLCLFLSQTLGRKKWKLLKQHGLLLEIGEVSKLTSNYGKSFC